jgi:uncharacterized protein (TIGR02246 family)
MESPSPNDQEAVRAVYDGLVRAWNTRDAVAFAALFIADGSIVGYDGTVVDGQAEIASHIGAIFVHHQTPAYIQKAQRVRFLSDEVAVLRGIVGMPSLATTTINPTLNAIQTLIVCQRDGDWRIALFQNTPAQFHGRPELVAQMTDELQQLLDDASR